MTLIDGDRIITAQLYDDEHEEFTEKKMSIIEYVNAYTDEGVTEADVVEQTDVPVTNVGDLIGRQAVDELSKALVHTTKDKADFLCHFWEGLQKLPPVTPKAEQKWIPCSERMPEKHGDYLVTIENGDVFNCYFNPDYCYDGYDNGAFTYTQEYFDHETMGSLGAEEFAYDGVVAWMSYEPYKEESKLDGDPVDIDKAVEHYEGTLEVLKDIDLEVDE